MAQKGYEYGLEYGTMRWKYDHKPEQFGVQQARRHHRIKSPVAAELNSHLMSERPQKPRNQSNWASGGPGMQAVFLGSNRRSCGTGVFLPRREGTHIHFRNKPALSPVLLPARVVQALNLNVHELISQQINPQPEDEPKNNAKRVDENLEKKRDDKICLSPDIFLPKEWTY